MHPSLRRLLFGLLIAPTPILVAVDEIHAQTSSVRPTAQEVGKAADAFLKRPVKEQEAIAAALRGELDAIADATLPHLRTCATAALTASEPRTKAFPSREAGKRASKPDARRDTDLIQRAEYVFGLGTIEHSDTEPTKKPQRPAWEATQRRHLVHTSLLGMPPDADRAVAELLRILDRDSSADRFAAFLESWRNGTESFYEALDRTAGTDGSVFFYDAMLHDFAGIFAPGSAEAASIASLGNAHDALHNGFLSYRQYRAFREAVAWSLVLPPDHPLPKCLARYEAPVKGAYSLREQVLMVLATLDYDPRAVATKIAATAAALPVPLWQESYNPYPQWNTIFGDAMPKMIAQAESTDAWLAAAKKKLGETASTIRNTAQRHLNSKPSPNR